MEPNKGQKPEESNDSDQDLDNVIDELRSVLSGLDREPSPVEELKAPPVPPSDPLLKDPLVSSPDPHPESQPAFETFEEEPAALEMSNSAEPENNNDADDFWSGNVLGWTEDAEEKNAHPPKNEPTPDDWMRSQSKESAEKISELRPELEVPSSDSGMLENPLEEVSTNEPSPPEPALEIPEKSALEEPALPLGEPAPVSPEEKPPKASEKEIDSLFDPGFTPSGPEGIDVDQDETLILPPPPRSPAEMKSSDEMDIPIPGTLDQRDPDPKKEEFSSEEGKKPEGLMQVACFFPEGKEKSGQHFLSNLKRACEKSTKKINVEPVLIQAYAEGQHDIASWAKAAKLAGADMTYVIVFRDQREPFKALAVVMDNEGLKSRLVVVEQVGLRALYADALIELKRFST